jgi:Sap, sulfolipid-1-addressing protein
VISRPRPVQNLVVCWVGCLITNVPALLVPLLMLHVMPVFRSTAHDLATAGPNSTARHIQLGMGVLALSISPLIAVRSRARQREHVPVGNSSTLVLDSDTPTAISLPQGRDQDGSTERGSAIRRLIDHVNTAWENGSLWVALVAGMTVLPGRPRSITSPHRPMTPCWRLRRFPTGSRRSNHDQPENPSTYRRPPARPARLCSPHRAGLAVGGPPVHLWRLATFHEDHAIVQQLTNCAAGERFPFQVIAGTLLSGVAVIGLGPTAGTAQAQPGPAPQTGGPPFIVLAPSLSGLRAALPVSRLSLE